LLRRNGREWRDPAKPAVISRAAAKK
jgi:hypothetical protein